MNKKINLKFTNYYIIPILVAIFNIIIIMTPNLVISSAKNGLLLWFNNIVPAILPFLIGTNLLIKLGFIDFLGNLLQPFMKKFFNISGNGAFPLILGMFSGYPIGAKITCELLENEKISKIEAQRLISFTNNSGPLFIIGTVGIGMFNNIKIGYLMLIIHYISALTIGFLFKFYKCSNFNKNEKSNKISIKKAFKNLKTARLKENKSLGEILSESVKNSLETICMIGGFVILFSVISEILKSSNVFNYIGNLIFPENLAKLSNGFFLGIIEITNGVNILSEYINKEAVILSCALISFSGLSIVAQTASIVGKTQINFSLYIISKILHSIVSAVYCILSLPLINKFLNESSENVFNTFEKPILKTSLLNFLISGLIILIICFLTLFLNKYFNTKKRNKRFKR